MAMMKNQKVSMTRNWRNGWKKWIMSIKEKLKINMINGAKNSKMKRIMKDKNRLKNIKKN